MVWNWVSSSPLIVRLVARRMLETGFPGLGVPQLGSAGGVADQDDFVDAAHPSIIAMLCKNCV